MTDSLMRLHIATSDPDEAHDWLRGAYTDHSATLSGRSTAFRFTHSVADCGAVKIGVARHTMSLHSTWQPLDDILLFSHLLEGRFTIRSAVAEIAAGPGDLFTYDPDVAMTVDWHDIRMAQVRIQRSAVERFAAETVGDDRGPMPLTWDLARPLSASKGVHWKRMMQYVTGDVVANPAVHSSPLLMRQVQRLVIATALETFPNSSLAVPRGSGSPASPDAVRRACAYIEEHAAADIDLTSIARAAHVGPRALQRAFRRAMDVTPLGYLRSIRLDRAHAQLKTADPADGTTVAAVALHWGFGHPGRFAADYRARFGHSPSDTLRE